MKKINKNILLSVLIFIGMSLLTWLSFAFLQWNIDPSEYKEGARFMMIIIVIFFSPVLMAFCWVNNQ